LPSSYPIVKLVIEDKNPGVPIATEEEFFQTCSGMSPACEQWKVSSKIITEGGLSLYQAEIFDPLLSLLPDLFKIGTDL
jgi:hypothetical protein